VGLDIEPHAANSRTVHFFQFTPWRRGVDHRDAAGAPREPPDGIDGTGIIVAIDAGLHDHHAVKPKVALQLDEVFDRSGRWRVDAVGGKRKLRRIADDVDMTIACAVRHVVTERRFRRVGG